MAPSGTVSVASVDPFDTGLEGVTYLGKFRDQADIRPSHESRNSYSESLTMPERRMLIPQRPRVGLEPHRTQ